MHPFFSALLVSVAAGVVGTGLGGVVTVSLRHTRTRTVGALLAFAAGVMVGVSSFDLLPEALSGGAVPLALVASVVAGSLSVYLLGRFPSSSDGKDGRNLKRAGLVTAAAIALHNVPEGMVLGAFCTEDTLRGALLMSGVIGLHNIPEGMAIAAPLCADGVEKSKAVLLTALSGVPTVAGAVLGYAVGALGPTMQGLLLAFAAGAMLFVSFEELYPGALSLCKRTPAAFCLTAGVLVGLCVSLL